MLTWLTELALILATFDTRPPASDVERLPSFKFVRERWNESIAYRDYVQDLTLNYPNSPHFGEWAAAHREAQSLTDWWYAADNARMPRLQPENLRYRLDELRSLSWPAYYSGVWPPSIPWWRLQRANR